MYYVYIVECSDGTYYTGYTNNIEERIKKHNQGKGARYTRGRGPVILQYSESFSSRSRAMKREYEIKQLSRKEKKVLLKG
ncbi:GIY-YIG nuclease family protein [Halocella sp. SP3-1]|uniref:GIY-YIG nuclease family protein n=1 Tax=Halocella sp. SP3-1 TaxID=2382161 RepID=UPI000F755E3F|nr:GIY-YIG nuclease family protein [Halocella sp. SP3-1]